MNTIYRIVWNAATGKWVVASELAKGRKKKAARVAGFAAAVALGLSFGGNAAMAQSAAPGESCTMPSGKAGTVDETGFCMSNAAGDSIGLQSIGTMGTVDDSAFKVNGATAASASGARTIAIGSGAQSNNLGTADGNIAVGSNAVFLNTGAGAMVLGRNAQIAGTGGNGATTGAGSIAIGDGNAAAGKYTIYGNNVLALGKLAPATGSNTAAVAHSNATVIGGGASNTGNSATVLGANASAPGAVSGVTALGYGSTSSRGSTLALGSTTSRRQLVDVSAGTQAADAVIVDQLAPVVGALGGGASINPTTGAMTAPTYTVGGTNVSTVAAAVSNLDGRSSTATTNITNLDTQLASGSIGLVQQNASQDITFGATTGGSDVNFAGNAGARTLSGVAEGDVSSSSTQAVNGAQLNTVNAAVASNTAALDALTLTKTAMDLNVSTNTTAINTLQAQLEDGSVGLVQQDAVSGNLTVAASMGGKVVDIHGTAGARTLTGVADGTLSTTSTDAVNGGQLGAINTQVAQNADSLNTLTTTSAALDGRITTNTNDIATLQSQVADGLVGLVQQDAVSGNLTVAAARGGSVVNLAGAEGVRKLTGVSAGELSDTSNELVNGAQVNDTNELVVKNTTALDTLNTSVSNIDGRVTTTTGTLTNLQAQLDNGSIGLVQQNANGIITVAAQNDGGALDLRGTDGERVLSGVGNGAQDADVVAYGQLKAAGVVDPGGNVLNPLTYDDLSLASARLGGLHGTIIDNLAAGAIVANSMQAINGGQLYDWQQNVQGQFDALVGQVGQLGDRVGVIEQGLADGSIGGPGNGGGGGGGGGGSIGGPGTGDNSLVVGEGANASGSNSAAIGNGAAASGNGSTATGAGAVASGNNGTAVGAGASATADNAAALGAGSIADRDNSVSVGSAGNERQITHVAAGTAATDAVNVQQLSDMRDWSQGYTDARMGALDSKIGSVSQRAHAGTAAAIATANMPQGYRAGQNALAMGVGTFNGQSAVAAGVTTISKGGRWVFRGSVSANTQGDAGIGLSAGMAW